jgi:hypothetical protein
VVLTSRWSSCPIKTYNKFSLWDRKRWSWWAVGLRLQAVARAVLTVYLYTWLPFHEVDRSLISLPVGYIPLITLPGVWQDIPDYPAGKLIGYIYICEDIYSWLPCQEVDRIYYRLTGLLPGGRQVCIHLTGSIKQLYTISTLRRSGEIRNRFIHTHICTPCVSDVFHWHCLLSHCMGKDRQAHARKTSVQQGRDDTMAYTDFILYIWITLLAGLLLNR